MSYPPAVVLLEATLLLDVHSQLHQGAGVTAQAHQQVEVGVVVDFTLVRRHAKCDARAARGKEAAVEADLAVGAVALAAAVPVRKGYLCLAHGD